ncbi:MAG: sensor histidine kinase [Gaiellaceae bacterium]
MRASRLLTNVVVDALVALLVIGAQVEVWTTSLPGARGWDALAVAGWTVPLFFRRRLPLLAPLALFTAIAAAGFVEPRLPPDTLSTTFGLVGGFWSAGAYNARNRALTAAAYGWLAICAAILAAPNAHATDLGWPIGVSVFSLLMGTALHTRAQQTAALEERAALLERRRREEARVAVAEERARIARELHDVVAHSVSVMTVQAGAVRRLLGPEQEREREALETVERTGREALAEMRRLLGVLRETEDGAALEPQPGLDQIDRLLERARTAGLPVELSVEGERRPLAPGVDLNAYRIVQEALTNALKHTSGATAEVRLRYEGDRLELEVANDGTAVLSGDGSGHGLVGMRERVHVCGGRLEAGPRPEGGFLVRATLPVESAR